MSELPFYMRGNFAPIEAESTFEELEVIGEVPASLSGYFMRIGPNPIKGDPGHWFFGDGMLHRVRLDGGRASGYRNRYVKTPSYLGEDVQMIGPDGNILKHTQTDRICNEMIVGDLDAELLAKARSHPNYTLRTRRPELFFDLVDEQVSC